MELSKSDLVRNALHDAVVANFPGGVKEAADAFGYPQKTFWRHLTPIIDGKSARERSKTIDWEFLVDVHAKLQNRFPLQIDDLPTFIAHATRHV